MKGLLGIVLWSSVAVGIFLAFGWPALVSGDRASVAYELIAKATLAAFFVTLAALLVLKARRGGR
jgi:hypothetical protein